MLVVILKVKLTPLFNTKTNTNINSNTNANMNTYVPTKTNQHIHT